jgi:hypothetical protein
MKAIKDALAAIATCLIFGGCIFFFMLTLGRVAGSYPVAPTAISHRAAPYRPSISSSPQHNPESHAQENRAARGFLARVDQ